MYTRPMNETENECATIHEGNTLALKYFKEFKKEVIKHNRTKVISERRLFQMRFLLVEQAQMQRELDSLRKQLGII